MDEWLNLIELFEYKVLDLYEGRTPKSGMRSVLMLRDVLLSAPLEGVHIRRFRRMDQIFKDLRNQRQPSSFLTQIEDRPVRHSSVGTFNAASEEDAASAEPATDPRIEMEQSMMGDLAEVVWQAHLKDRIRAIGNRLHHEAGLLTLRGLVVLLDHLESYGRSKGASDITLSQFRTQMPLPSEDDPRILSGGSEFAKDIVSRLVDSVLHFEEQFFKLDGPERLPYLMRMASLIADHPFVGKPSQRGLNSGELLDAMDSARRESMGSAARAELLERLQQQYNHSLQIEARQKQAFDQLQQMLKDGLKETLGELRALLPTRYGGEVDLIFKDSKILNGQDPTRVLSGDAWDTQQLIIHLVTSGQGRLKGISLTWTQQEAGSWVLEVAGAVYALPLDQWARVPLDEFEIHAYRHGDYLYLEVMETQGERLFDHLKVVDIIAALLEPGGQFFNLRLARGVAAWVRDGRVDLASLVPQSAEKFKGTPRDTLFGFARKGAEGLITRFRQLPTEMIEDAFGEVARLMGEKGGKERSQKVIKLFLDLFEGRAPHLLNGNAVKKVGEMVVMAYRGEPMSVEVMGRVLTLRSDYKGEMTVVAVGHPAEPVKDLWVYPAGEGFALLARQGLRVAVGYHETIP